MYDDMMMMMMIYVNTQKKTNTYEDYGIPLSQKTEKKERNRRKLIHPGPECKERKEGEER